jgi:hypothetical protein
MVRFFLVAATVWGGTAMAFCGFFVSTTGAKLSNTSSHVVLMRSGTRTVVSMRNDYAGPVEDFALVVPVPVVLQSDQVKTLPAEIFDKLERYTEPRLVKYAEADPCPPAGAGGFGSIDLGGRGKSAFRLEGRFAVGEYDVVILSASDALSLENWLSSNGYSLPDGAAAALRPFVQQGLKFFVAKVDARRVRFEAGRARLSPLRFHYDSESFSLPVRLGRLNGMGPQDLLVHVLARETQYEAANRPNVFLPTNVDLRPAAAPFFRSWLEQLFDRIVQKTPGAVVTEYAWALNNCDPCSGVPPTEAELLSLGLDVIEGPYEEPDFRLVNEAALGPVQAEAVRDQLGRITRKFRSTFMNSTFVVTRLHTRLDGQSDDLVFRAAPSVTGGREDDVVTSDVRATPLHSFQARYAIRQPWTMPVTCRTPAWGNWVEPARAAAVEQRVFEGALESLVESPVPSLKIKGLKAAPGASFKGKLPKATP